MTSNDKESLTQKTVNLIRASVKNGFYKPGDRLPNEMDLSQELGISRATLREAIKVLVSANVLEVKRGIGTYISNPPGVSDDPLGLFYLNPIKEKNQVVRLSKMLLKEVGAYIKVMAVQSHIELPKNPVSAEHSVKAVFGLFKHITNEMALEVYYRVLVLLENALLQLVQSDLDVTDSVLSGYVNRIYSAVYQRSVETLADEIDGWLDMFIIQVKEVD